MDRYTRISTGQNNPAVKQIDRHISGRILLNSRTFKPQWYIRKSLFIRPDKVYLKWTPGSPVRKPGRSYPVYLAVVGRNKTVTTPFLSVFIHSGIEYILCDAVARDDANGRSSTSEGPCPPNINWRKISRRNDGYTLWINFYWTAVCPYQANISVTARLYKRISHIGYGPRLGGIWKTQCYKNRFQVLILKNKWLKIMNKNHAEIRSIPFIYLKKWKIYILEKKNERSHHGTVQWYYTMRMVAYRMYNKRPSKTISFFFLLLSQKSCLHSMCRGEKAQITQQKLPKRSYDFHHQFAG